MSKTFVVDQLVGLARAGHRLRVIADPPRPGEKGSPDDVPPELRGLITYRNPPERDLPSNGRRLVSAVVQGLRISPRAVLELLGSRDLPLYQRMQLLELLAVVARTGDPDVFHCHFGVLGAEVVRVREALGFHAPVVTAFHGYDISSHLARHGPDAFDHLFEYGDLFLPISERWRDRIVEIGAPEERVEIQRMGVDITRFKDAVARPQTARLLRILSVGRMVEKKGFAFGLRAVAELRARGIDVEYTIVGDGPEREHLEAIIDELELGADVRLAGARPRREVHELMATHDVLLCPSVTASNGDSEGIPIVLMEAMATGIPVVSTWHSGIPELVHDGSSGLLAEEGDVDGLAERLCQLERDPELASQLVRNGRQRVASEFNAHRLVGQLEERLRGVITSPLRPAPGGVPSERSAPT